MQEKIREIVSVYTRIPPGEIGPATVIDRAAIGNSIMLHRMYARLAEAGVIAENYGSIRNFADLMRYAEGAPDPGPASSGWTDSAGMPPAGIPSLGASSVGDVGIDIEEVGLLPRTDDFRKNEFYKMNFGPAEIAYCILQSDPYASFAGLFAAKEAIVKANNQYRSGDFRTIAIGHTPEGKPMHPEFHLSISHAGNFAIAVAIPSGMGLPAGQAGSDAGALTPAQKKAGSPAGWLGWLSLAIAAIALFFALKR